MPSRCLKIEANNSLARENILAITSFSTAQEKRWRKLKRKSFAEFWKYFLLPYPPCRIETRSYVADILFCGVLVIKFSRVRTRSDHVTRTHRPRISVHRHCIVTNVQFLLENEATDCTQDNANQTLHGRKFITDVSLGLSRNRTCFTVSFSGDVAARCSFANIQ